MKVDISNNYILLKLTIARLPITQRENLLNTIENICKGLYCYNCAANLL